jgi:hypothetical protein
MLCVNTAFGGMAGTHSAKKEQQKSIKSQE